MRNMLWLTPLLVLMAMFFGCPDHDDDEGDDDTSDDDAGDDDTGDDDTADPCGNGECDPGEECDAGELNGASNCNDDCMLEEDLQWALGQDVLDMPIYDAVAEIDAEAPLGEGAWNTSDTDQNLDSLVKFEFNVPGDPYADFDLAPFTDLLPADLPCPEAIGEMKLADIASIQYQTRKITDVTTNFYLAIYTMPDGVDDQEDWYGYMLLAHPYLARNYDETLDTWTTWDTIDGTNQLVFADKSLLGQSSGEGLPTLPELQASDSFDWSVINAAYPSTAVDYGAEAIKYISIQTSSGAPSSEFDGRVDALVITTTDDRSLTIDFEPAPAS